MDSVLLDELGFTKAGKILKVKKDLKARMAVAYEHYRFVEPHVFNRFQAQVKEKTYKVTHACPSCGNHPKRKQNCGYCGCTGAQEATYDRLKFIKISDYPDSPPMDCLMDLKKAKDLKVGPNRVFDEFEIAKVESVVDRPDPIIFGIIKGCKDYFYITQWDNDVKIEQILNQNEG